MKFSLKSLFGIILVSAISINPIRFIASSNQVEYFWRVFANINLWFLSFFLYFEPEYYNLIDVPYARNSSIAFATLFAVVFAIVIWMGIIFWTSCFILELFGYKTALRSKMDKLEYKYKVWRMKRNENKI